MFAFRQSVQNLRTLCLAQHGRTVTQLAGRSFLPDSTSKNFPKFLQDSTEDFPYVFKLNIKSVPKPELSKFGHSFRPLLDRMVDKYGVVILRGFNMDGAIPFSEFFQALGYPTMRYYSGTGIRAEVAKLVAAPRCDPPICTVEPHNEMSCFEDYPHLAFLFCEEVPSRSCGGEIVLVDSRDILHDMDERVMEKFKRLGVRYYHHLPGGQGVFPSWKEEMETTEKGDVEKHLKKMKTQYIRWHEDGSLTYWSSLPAFRRHYNNGDMVWFNQAVNLHASHWRAHPKYIHVDLPETHYPHTTLYGDGTPIEHEVLQHLREITWKNAVATKFHKGDIMVMDNMYIQHGRLGYTGKRKVLISLATRDSDDHDLYSE